MCSTNIHARAQMQLINAGAKTAKEIAQAKGLAAYAAFLAR
jgi:hypothetical protein